MNMRSVLNVSLSESMAKAVKKESKDQGFGSASEFIRHLIRLWNTEKLIKIVKDGDSEFKTGKTKVIKSFSDIK